MARNIFDDIKHAGQHAGDAIKHGAEDAGKTIQHQADDVAHGDFDKAGHDIKHDTSAGASHAKHSAELIGDDLEHAIMTTMDDITHLGDKIKGEINHIINEAKNSIEAERKSAWNSLNSMKHAVEKDIEKAEGEAKAVLDKAAQEAVDGLKKAAQYEKDGWTEFGEKIKADIENEFSGATAHLTEEAIQKGIEMAHKGAVAVEKAVHKLEDKAPTLVDLLNNQSLPINLGPIVLTYSNGVQRIDDIADALEKVSGENFKLTQTFINDLLHGLGPDTISIHADIEFFVEVGLDLDDVPFEAFVEIADIIFDALGVPE